MKPDTDYIALILDRSGSMSDHWDDTIGGGRQFLADLANVADRTVTLTFVCFDDTLETVVQSHAGLSEEFARTIEFAPPRGSTALLDAIGHTIVTVGTELAATPEYDRPEKVYVVVLTDGHENASREFTLERVKGMVEHQSDTYGWQFIFLGADLSAIDTGEAMGFKRDASVQYATSKKDRAFANTSAALNRARRNKTDVAYFPAERDDVL